MILAGSCTLLALFSLPETFAFVLLTRKARRLRRVDPEKNKDLYTESERVSWAPTIYLSLVYGLIFSSTFSWLLQTSYTSL